MMPFIFSERLPVPSLRSYCIISGTLFGASVAYLKNVYHESVEKEENKTYHEVFQDTYRLMLSEPFVLWPFVNMVFCFLFVFGKLIQIVILGKLRVTEEQHLQDRFWNFVFYKFIFIFGIVNAQSLHAILCWTTWFLILGFLTIFSQLCKDRYEHNTSSPNTQRSTHLKLLCLIISIAVSSVILSSVALHYVSSFGLNQVLFMLEECIILGLKSTHMLVKYIFHLKNLLQTGMWDRKAKFIYYTDFTLKLSIMVSELVFHFHMLIWSNVFLSMASLVLYWNIRSIFYDMKKTFMKHRIYRKILKSVDRRFPFASKEELENFEDHCAICWDSMESARKLPCSHLFHHGCLCSWLEQDVSCPTCRRSLSIDIGLPPQVIREGEEADNIDAQELQEIAENRNENNGGGGLRNYFFYLDGQQIANWFPSFSIEVFHGQVDGNDPQIDEMAQNLSNMFPHISREAIIADLQRTNSVEATADNILEGGLPTIPFDEAPQAIADRPSQNTATNTETVLPNLTEINAPVEAELSDTESFVEDSSGTEDAVVTITRPDGTENNSVRRRLGTIATAQRRHRIKQHRSQPSSDISSTESLSDGRQDKDDEQRRSLILEAIEKRTGPQNT